MPQSGDGVSHAPKIEVAQARLDWTAPAVRLDRLVRGCTPDPGGWTTFRGERLGVDVVELHPEPVVPAVAPGELVVQRRAVLVGTGDGALRLTTVRPAGRRAMSALDWARGARPTPGERLA